jgi:hypothetical protein
VFSTIISSGDFNGGGKSDVIAHGWAGTLWMHPGDGTGGFLQREAVGAGWSIFSTIPARGSYLPSR